MNLDTTTVAGVLNIVVVVVAVIISGFFAFFIMNSAMLAKFYSKIGVPVWRAWVPVFQFWNFFELAEIKGYWALLGIFEVFELQSILELPDTVAKLIDRIQILGVTGDWSAAFNFGATPGPLGFLWDTVSTLVPEAGIIALGILAAVVSNRVAHGFGKDPVRYTALYLFLQPVYFAILGFGKAQFDVERMHNKKPKKPFLPQFGAPKP